MNSAYTYRGYAIEVRCEHKVYASDTDVPTDDVSYGFVAIVHIRAANMPSLFLGPVRLADDHGKLFAESLDALRAGRSAGETLVDDLLTGASVNIQR
ncbi:MULTISPECIES: hydrogenase maturation factor [unclassified Burkholderia]|uniref:hydrogenase maturation factor n=1 Tax=unclassified Burkholderia TaxID=2613784 RepID=UPI001E5B90C8|nr:MULTISPECIES: hydrogenase maturation factor [unclassified Burkholderia]UEP29605.1 hydrogenase maturation factor [Burkholderia sp. B21-007]UEP45081.1 hydrogenase maturation factor [Burkholderia sp. B21-005]